MLAKFLASFSTWVSLIAVFQVAIFALLKFRIINRAESEMAVKSAAGVFLGFPLLGQFTCIDASSGILATMMLALAYLFYREYEKEFERLTAVQDRSKRRVERVEDYGSEMRSMVLERIKALPHPKPKIEDDLEEEEKVEDLEDLISEEEKTPNPDTLFRASSGEGQVYPHQFRYAEQHKYSYFPVIDDNNPPSCIQPRYCGTGQRTHKTKKSKVIAERSTLITDANGLKGYNLMVVDKLAKLRSQLEENKL